MTEVVLNTSRSVDPKTFKKFSYNIEKAGKDILTDALDNLNLTDPTPHLLMLKCRDGVFRLVNLNANFKDMDPPDNSLLLVVKEQTTIKISTEHNVTRTILLKLTVPIHDLLEVIAEKLHIHCQPFQYSLYSLPTEEEIENDKKEVKKEEKMEKPKPLDSSLTIAEQAKDYSNLLFRRRFYLVFIDEFDDFDNALHVYRDIREHYLRGICQLPNQEKAVELAFYMIYADSKNAHALSEYLKLLNEDPSSFFPKHQHMIKKSTFKKELLKKLETDEPPDRHYAMMQFIVNVRQLNNYGVEKYRGRIIDPVKGAKFKCAIFAGPRGVKVFDREETKEIENCHILKIQSYSTHIENLVLNWMGPGGRDDPKTISLRSLSVGLIYSMIKENISLIESHYINVHERRRQRANGVGKDLINLVGGQYSTLIDAEQAIEMFINEMKEYEDVDFRLHGLKIVTTAAECQAGDKIKFNEMDEIKALVSDKTELGGIIYKHLPQITYELMSGKALLKKIQILEEDIISIRGSVYHLHIKDCVYMLQTAINYSNVISLSFKDIDPLVSKSRQHLTSLLNLTIENDKKGRGIIEMSAIIVEELNKALEELNPLKAKINAFNEQHAPHQPAPAGSLSKLPCGQLTCIVLVNAIDEFLNYAFQNRYEIRKSKEIFIENFFMPLGESYSNIVKVVEAFLFGKEEAREHFGTLVQFFKTFNSFVTSVKKAENVDQKIQHNLTVQIKTILKSFHVLQITILKDDEFIGLKLYPGTTSYIPQTLNSIKEIENLLKIALKNDAVANNKNIEGRVKTEIDFITKGQAKIQQMQKKIDIHPSDEATRVEMIQQLHEIKSRLKELNQEILSTPAAKIFESLPTHLEKIDNSLYTLTPDNCSPPRVDTCIRSLTAIINAMIEKQIDQQWIDRLQVTLDKIKLYYKKLQVSPTDGYVLQPLHELLIIVLRYIQTIEKYLSIAEHRTIPLIIELLAPTIVRSLGNPYITDEFERCDHIIKMNQMHHDIVQVINMFSTVFEWPNICVESDVVDDLKKRIGVLQKLFVEFAQLRPIFMSNPYTYVLALPILRLLNHVKITEANMIAKTREIDNLNMSTAMRKCLCQSMLSVKAFLESVKILNIRPYRKIPTEQTILDYRKNLIGLVAFIKNVSVDASKETADLLSIESRKFMKFISDVSKAAKLPSHKFDELVLFIDSYLDGIFGRNNIPEFTNSDEAAEKVDQLQLGNEKIIRGETPTAELLEKLIVEMIKNMNNFHMELPTKNGKIPPDVRDKLLPWDNQFQIMVNKIQPIIADHSYPEETIIKLRKEMLVPLRKIIELPEEYSTPESLETNKEKPFFELCNTTYCSLDDTVNLTRQFPEPTLITLNWQKLEVSIAEEIQELSEVVVEQFKELSDVFSEQILPHPIVKKSSRLTKLVNELQLFYINNYEILNQSKEKIESTIEQFCREIIQTLEVINDNVRLLHPIMSNDDLIESADALAKNVELVIKRFDQHHMTQQTASEYIKSVIPEIQKLLSKFNGMLDDPMVAQNPGLLDFFAEIKKQFGLLPEDLLSLKPSQIQQHCDKLYEYLLEKIPQLQNLLNDIGIGGQIISLYNELMKYTSLEHKQILISAPLLVKGQAIPSSEIQKFMNEIINLMVKNPNNVSLQSSEALLKLFDKLGQYSSILPQYINTMQKALSPLIAQGNPAVLMSAIRCLTLSEMNNDIRNKNLMDLMINASCSAAKILDDLTDILKKIPPVTIYHDQLLNLLQQIDTSALTQLKTIPAFLMTYAKMRQVSGFLPLLQIEDQRLNQLSNQYREYINEADLALTNDILANLDQLVNCLEVQGFSPEFVQQMAKMLLSTNRGLTFDLNMISKIAEVYLKFDSDQSAEVNKQALRFDKMKDAKNHMDFINQYKPILQQWMNPSSSTSASQLETALKSIISSLLSHLETCSLCLPGTPNKVPFYFALPRAEIDQMINLVETAKANNIDVRKYLPAIKLITDLMDMIDRACEQIFNDNTSDKAKQSFIENVPNLIKCLMDFFKTIGPIEIANNRKDSRIEREREQERRNREEEEKFLLEHQQINLDNKLQPEVDYMQLVIDIYKSIAAGDAKKTAELLKQLKSCLQNNMTDLLPLKEWIDKVEKLIQGNNFKLIGNTVPELSQFLIDKIKWQSNILKSNLSLSNVNDTFIEHQRALNEIAIHYLDSSNKPSELEKLAKIAADTQALTVHSYKFFENFPTFLFYDLYQTSVQMWGSLLNLFGNPTNVAVKRSFRSIARLHAGLSYLVEDASMSAQNNNSLFKAAQFKFLSDVSILYQDTALVISTLAASPYDEIYNIMIKDISVPFSQHIKNVSLAGEKMMSLNTLQDANKKFNTKKAAAEQAFLSFTKCVNHPKNLKEMIDVSQALHVALQSLCKVAKTMNDVIIQQPDNESASKLPNRVVLPVLPAGELNFQKSIDSLLKTQDNLVNKHDEIRKMLFDVSDVNNKEIVDKVNEYLEIGKQFVKDALQTSNASTNIMIQEDLASSAINVINGLEALNKSVRDKLLLKSGWVEDADNALQTIIKEINKIHDTGKKGAEYEEESQKMKSDEDNKVRVKFDESAKLLRDSRKKFEEILTSLSDQPKTPNNEWANEISKLGVSSVNTLMKVLAHLSTHRSEMQCTVEKLPEHIKEMHKKYEEVIKKIKDIISAKNNSEDVENNAIEVAKLIKSVAESLNTVFLPKSADGKLLAGTIEQIVKGAEQLQKAAEQAKMKKEEIAKRKKEAEEKRRSMAKSKQPSKTPEELKKRLDLESKIIQARMVVDYHKAKLAALG